MPITPVQVLNQRRVTVEQVAAAWPDDQPLVMLHSAARDRRWGRWSVLSSPLRYETSSHSGADPLAWLNGIINREDAGNNPDASHACTAFAGGWIGYFSYELGRIIEPAARYRDAHDQCQWPLIELAYCPTSLLYDHCHERWHSVGEAGFAEAVIERLDAPGAIAGHWQAGVLTCDRPADAHIAAVTRAIQYIAAGDIFQANITQQIRSAFSGNTRSLALHALACSGARYGAYLELPDGRCIISMSPELFLEVEASSRQVTTRPIKGTRPQHEHPSLLANSCKDAAELHMITDLMRNDLGRVCEAGSVQVNESRVIETHPTVHHGVSTVVGRLRQELRLSDLLAATFPAGSITGAPKIRAMQIIEELEPTSRGPYCGAIGMISRCGNMTLNVAIRTMVLQGSRPGHNFSELDGELSYGAGGGIVADSQPLSEYRESMDKTAILRLALRQAKHALAHRDQ